MKKVAKLTLLAALTVMMLTLAACAGNGSPASAFKTYCSGTSSQNIKKTAGALFEKDSTEYNAYVEVAEKAKEASKDIDASGKAKITVKKTDFTIDGEKASGNAKINIKGKVKLGSVTIEIDEKDLELKGISFIQKDGKWYLVEASYNVAYSAAMATRSIGGIFG